MIEQGDIIEWCKSYSGEKFHAVLCDPPYELGFMGKSWDSTGVAFDKETWRAISRHLYPGAYLLAFGGTRTFHRIAVAIEDAGFEIRDTVMWVYGSGFPKSHDVSKAIDREAGAEREPILDENGNQVWTSQKQGKKSMFDGGKERPATYPATYPATQWSGYGTALKPSWEPVIIARKPLEGTVAHNAQKYGSGALNIDGCRVGSTGRTTRGDTSQNHKSPSGAFTTGHDVVELQGGRWPANLIHDGSDEVVGMFPNTGPSKSGMRGLQSKGYSAGADYETKDGTNSRRDHDDLGGSAARFFYSAKVSKRERDAGLEGFKLSAWPTMGDGIGGQPDQHRENNRNTHPTLKPIALTTYLAKLILPPKLDQPRRLLVPFAGSGSEVIGGYLAGWDEVLGVEREPEYVKIAEARMNYWTNSSPQSSSSSTSVPPESTDGQETFGI